MIKILNDRPLFYCFLAFGFGILLAKPIFSVNIFYCVLTALIFAIITFFCIKFKKIISISLIFICFLIGFLSFYLSSLAFNVKDYGTAEMEISGRVCVSTIYENSQNVIIDNVYVNKNKINKCINVHIYSSTDIEEGYVLTFSAVINKNTLFTLGSFNSYNYKYNIPYSCSVDLENITIDGTNELYWSERLRLNVKDILFKNMGEDEASVSYASLFGDKTYIDSQIKSNFSVSGIAHLLAVSGLHIGFLVTLLSFLLNKTKTNKYAKTAIIVAVLGIYAYLCNFSASVLRASIMFFILNLAGLLGKKYDRLNAWSTAGIICLLFKPLSVFDGGFLLSFASVLCIFMFAKPLEKLFIKWHIPKKLASTLGVMVPVQFGLIPLIAMYYSEMSILSIITNFLCIPIFEIFFMLLFLFVPIVLLLPFMSFLLAVPEFIIGGIIKISGFISNQKFAIINLTTLGGLVVVLIYVILFILSHYVNLNKFKKTITCGLICALSLVSIIIQSHPVVPTNNKITIINTGKPVYFLELNNTSFAVGYFDNYAIDLTTQYAHISRLYGVDYFISLNSSLPDKNLRGDLFKNVLSFGISSGEEKLTEDLTLKNNIVISPVVFGDNVAGLIIESDDIKIYFTRNIELNELAYLEFGMLYDDFDLIIGKDKYVEKYNDFSTFKYTLADGNIIKNSNKILNNKNGCWTFELNNNIITNMRGVD